MISSFCHLLITSELESTKLATSQSLCGKEAARMEKVFWKLFLLIYCHHIALEGPVR